MKKLQIPLALALFIFILSSCTPEENPTDPGDNNEEVEEKASDYMPLAEGNWWKYKEYYTDENGEQIGEDFEESTLTVISKTELEGKTAYDVSNGSSADPVYYSSDSDNIYIYNKMESSEASPGWHTLMSLTELNWVVAIDTFTTTVNVGETHVPANMTRTTVGHFKEKTTITFKGETYDAVRVNFITTTEGEYEENGAVKQTDPETRIREYLFVRNIGLYSVKSIFDEPEDGKFGRKAILADFEIKN